MASRLDDLIREHAERLEQVAGPVHLADVTSGPRDDTTTVAFVDIEPTRNQPGSRHSWAVIAVTAAAVAAIVVVGLVIGTRTDDPTGTVPVDQPTTVAPTPTVSRAPIDPTTSELSTTTSEAADDGRTILAKGEDVELRGYTATDGWTLNIDAEEQDGVVTGELRVDNVVVTIQCAGTRTSHGDLILGGVVTDNTDGIAMVDEVDLAVGKPVALIIRNASSPVGQRVTLYHPSLWYGAPASRHAGSCIDLVESVPGNLDGGFFESVAVDHIETG